MSVCDSQGQILSCKRKDAGTRENSKPSDPWDALIKRQKFHLGKYKAIMGLSLCSAENKWEIGCVGQGHEIFPGQVGAGDLSLPKGAALRNGSVPKRDSCQEDSWGIEAFSLNSDSPGAFVHCRGPSLRTQKVPLGQQWGQHMELQPGAACSTEGIQELFLRIFFK